MWKTLKTILVLNPCEHWSITIQPNLYVHWFMKFDTMLFVSSVNHLVVRYLFTIERPCYVSLFTCLKRKCLSVRVCRVKWCFNLFWLWKSHCCFVIYMLVYGRGKGCVYISMALFYWMYCIYSQTINLYNKWFNITWNVWMLMFVHVHKTKLTKTRPT